MTATSQQLLLEGIKFQNPAIIQQALKDGANPYRAEEGGLSPISQLAQSGHIMTRIGREQSLRGQGLRDQSPMLEAVQAILEIAPVTVQEINEFIHFDISNKVEIQRLRSRNDVLLGNETKEVKFSGVAKEALLSEQIGRDMIAVLAVHSPSGQTVSDEISGIGIGTIIKVRDQQFKQADQLGREDAQFFQIVPSRFSLTNQLEIEQPNQALQDQLGKKLDFSLPHVHMWRLSSPDETQAAMQAATAQATAIQPAKLGLAGLLERFRTAINGPEQKSQAPKLN